MNNNTAMDIITSEELQNFFEPGVPVDLEVLRRNLINEQRWIEEKLRGFQLGDQFLYQEDLPLLRDRRQYVCNALAYIKNLLRSCSHVQKEIFGK